VAFAPLYRCIGGVILMNGTQRKWSGCPPQKTKPRPAATGLILLGLDVGEAPAAKFGRSNRLGRASYRVPRACRDLRPNRAVAWQNAPRIRFWLEQRFPNTFRIRGGAGKLSKPGHIARDFN
jgi:hypothetical protein